MISRRHLLSALSVLPAARLIYGQDRLPTLKKAPSSQSAEGDEKPKMAEAKPVTVFVTVKEKSSGKRLKDLTQDDFTLEEEGRPQTIKLFQAGAATPLSLGILAETSFQLSRELGEERTEGTKFLDRILGAKDEAFVIHFDREIELLQDFTSSHDKLGIAMNLLQPAQPKQQQSQQGGSYPQGGGYPGGGYPGGGYPGGGGRRYPQGGGYGRRSVAKLYDAILLASEDLMSKRQGRKALILMADGVDSGSKTTQFEALSAAQKADVMIHAIHVADDTYGGPEYGGMGRRRMPMPSGGSEGPDGKKILQQFADETGGSFNSVGSFHHLDKILADVEDNIRSQYSIAYIPDPLSEVGLYRHIHLTAKLKKKDLVVQARAGYYVR